MHFFNELINDKSFEILIIVIVLDIIFGILRAIKEKELNSTIGIDGIIRKVGMLVSILFLCLIDKIVEIDLIGFIPQSLKEYFNIQRMGISHLFNILFIGFEILSIFKNMILCKLPIPKQLKDFIEKVMNEFTKEIKKGE